MKTLQLESKNKAERVFRLIFAIPLEGNPLFFLMLNRRLLRIKTMQSLFSALLAAESEWDIQKTYLQTELEPDSYDTEKIHPYTEGDKLLGLSYYDLITLSGGNLEDEIGNAEVKKLASHYAYRYKNNTQLIFERTQTELMRELDRIYGRYLDTIALLLDMPNQAHILEVERMKALDKQNPEELAEPQNLEYNRILKNLEESQGWLQVSKNHNPAWQANKDYARAVFREGIFQADTYQKYRSLETTTPEQDFEIADWISREIFAKHPSAVLWFEENDLHWDLNRKIIRSMVLKTLKLVLEKGTETGLAPMSPEWESSDRLFTETLYRTTVENRVSLDAILEKHSTNWTQDRMPTSDRAILLLALSELLHFKDVPVSVTINEFVEIAKSYSTPTSAAFINGVIDAAAKQLKEEGKLKKSAKGMMSA